MATLPKKQAVIPQDDCVSCGTCADVCPRNAISIIHGIYAQVDHKRCVGCGLCARECPAAIIRLEALA